MRADTAFDRRFYRALAALLVIKQANGSKILPCLYRFFQYPVVQFIETKKLQNEPDKPADREKEPKGESEQGPKLLERAAPTATIRKCTPCSRLRRSMLPSVECPTEFV